MSISPLKEILIPYNKKEKLITVQVFPDDTKFTTDGITVPVPVKRYREIPSIAIKSYYFNPNNSVQTGPFARQRRFSRPVSVLRKANNTFCVGNKQSLAISPRTTTIKNVSEKLTTEFSKHIHEAISMTKNIFGDLISNGGKIVGRKKDAESILPKLTSKTPDTTIITDNEEFLELCRSKIGDAYGTRIELPSLDTETTKNIIEENGMEYSEFTKNIQNYIEKKQIPPKEYIDILDKLKYEQTELIVNRIIEQKDNPNFQITRIENYGDELASYFTYDQTKRIAEAFDITMITLENEENRVDTPITLSDDNIEEENRNEKRSDAIKDSGYASCQMNITYKFNDNTNGYGELQVRGTDLNEFADAEHVLYNIRKEKTTEKNTKHSDIYHLLTGMSDKSFAKYNKYLTSIYQSIRMNELGLNIPMPEINGEYTYKNGKTIPAEELNKLSYSNIKELK